jgi:hypothetical protein
MSEQTAVEWLKRQDETIEFSKLGEQVAKFLDKLWGLHHLNKTSLFKVDWSNDMWVDVVIDKTLCTVDNNDLTRLVVIAHNMLLRIELKGTGPGYIKLTFHQRTTRSLEEGRYWQWCPTIKDHVKRINKNYKSAKEQPNE